jgi:hypothetical protein
MGNATQRTDEESDIFMELFGAGRVLNPTGPAVLRHWATVAVEEPLQHR